MKTDTFLLSAKALCYLVIGAGTPMSSALAQWANSHEWPDKITWVVVIIGSTVGGASSMLAFFSGAYSDYVKARTTGEVGPGPSTADAAAHPKTTEPAKP